MAAEYHSQEIYMNSPLLKKKSHSNAPDPYIEYE